MTTYKSYAECKIAHPDSEIVTTTQLHRNGPIAEFLPVKFLDGNYQSQIDDRQPNVSECYWVICNPADYCSSIKEFLDAGFELARGDLVVMLSGIADNVRSVSVMNDRDFNDYKRYILSAAALNGGCKIPAKAEQWTIYNNTLPLCELTDEQAAMLFNAWRSGDNMQALNDDEEWNDYDSGFYPLDVYRIKTKSERELFIDLATEIASDECETERIKESIDEFIVKLFDSGKFKLVIKDGE